MIGRILKALVFSGITLLGNLLLIGILVNAKSPVWLICIVVLVFTCVMFLFHGRRGSPRRRRSGYAGDAAAGYYVGSEGGNDGGRHGVHDSGGHDSGGGWFGGWGDGGGGGGWGDGGGGGGGDGGGGF